MRRFTGLLLAGCVLATAARPPAVAAQQAIHPVVDAKRGYLLGARVNGAWRGGMQVGAGDYAVLFARKLVNGSVRTRAVARYRRSVILSATTLHPWRAPTAAARRIHNVGCATTGVLRTGRR